MLNIDEEKDKLTKALSEQYSKNIINMEEYERILEYINKIETKTEINIIKKIIQENGVKNNEIVVVEDKNLSIEKYSVKEKHLAMFSWRTTNIKLINGNAGKYLSLFGTNRIIVDNLPKGKTIINVNSIFGLTEIIVPKNIKIINNTIAIFSGIFGPNEINTKEEIPELYIVGKAIFGNITIISEEENKNSEEFTKKLNEKIYQKIIDKI